MAAGGKTRDSAEGPRRLSRCCAILRSAPVSSKKSMPAPVSFTPSPTPTPCRCRRSSLLQRGKDRRRVTAHARACVSIRSCKQLCESLQIRPSGATGHDHSRKSHIGQASPTYTKSMWKHLWPASGRRACALAAFVSSGPALCMHHATTLTVPEATVA